VLLMFY